MPAESSQYLSIVFFGSHVVTALWQELNQRVSIIARSSLRLQAENESLPECVDLALEELGEESLSIRQVLFVVPQTWTDQGQLLNEKKGVLKELSEDLLLKPLGFVVLEDGLRSWQEQSTGQPFSGVIIQHLAEALQVKVYVAGETAAAFQIGKSGQVKDDIIELQARLKRYESEYDRVLYFETSGEDTNYNQLVVLLHKQLGKPVEKMTALQVADIAVSSGGLEMLGITTDNTHPPSIATVSNDESSTNQEENDEFRPPSFVVHQATASYSEEESTLDDQQDLDSNVEPVFSAKPKKKNRTWHWPTLPKMTLFSRSKSKKGLMLAVIPLLILAGLVAGYFSLRANYSTKVTVFIDNQKLEKMTILPLVIGDSPIAATQEALPAQKLTETVTVSKEVPTTGTKLTGEPAKGKVVIFNKTSEPKNFPQGTKIHSGNKSFSLDSEISVASASSQENRGSRTVTFGEQEVSVTAVTFGPEGNIPEKQEFKVDDFGNSSYYALNDKPFEGGTSRQIQAVAQKDVANAVEELLVEATQTLKERLQARSTQESPVLVTDQVTKDDSASTIPVGQEAKMITVSLTATGVAYQLQIEDLSSVAKKVFESDLQEGFDLQTNALNLKQPRLVSDGETPTLEVQLQAVASPNTDIAAMKNVLLGEYIARAQSNLEKFPGVKNVSTQLKPGSVGSIFKRFPQQSERIQIEVKAQNP